MGNAAPSEAAPAAPAKQPHPNEVFFVDNKVVEEVGSDVPDDFASDDEGVRMVQSSGRGVTEASSPFPPDGLTMKFGTPEFGERVGANPLGSLGSTRLGSDTYSSDFQESLMRSPMELPSGTILPSDSHGYTGERDELGQRHGDGVQLFPDGRRYSGQFDSNTFNGAGIMVWPDGHRYTGQYENNHKSGDGFFVWPDGRFYDGQWKMGQRHGHGQYIAAESYVGEYSEGFRHGDGVLTWPDGKRFSGQFYRGALHGSAVMSWQDGRRYLGQYVDNQKQGEGMFYWPDGRMYEGQWRKGVRHGTSRFIDSSGDEHVGMWHKDRLVSSRAAPEPGVRDPRCEAPVSLLAQRPNQHRPQLPQIAETPVEEDPDDGAGALSPQTRQALDAADAAAIARETARTPGSETLTVTRRGSSLFVGDAEHPCYELHELRAMPHAELRGHAERLRLAFGEPAEHAVPQHDSGLLGWVYEFQARHLRPLMDATAKGGVVMTVDAIRAGHIPKPQSQAEQGSRTASRDRSRPFDDVGNALNDIDLEIQGIGDGPAEVDVNAPPPPTDTLPTTATAGGAPGQPNRQRPRRMMSREREGGLEVK